MRHEEASGDTRLRNLMVLTSFSPLFLLLLLRHFHFCLIALALRLCTELPVSIPAAFCRAWSHSLFGDAVVVLASLLWLIMTAVFIIGFWQVNASGWRSRGERIVAGESEDNAGLSFFASYVLPLMFDDVETHGKLIALILTVCLTVALVMRSKLFYQNPVIALVFRSFTFRFKNPADDVSKEQAYIGLARSVPTPEQCIKRRYIADGVFLVSAEQ